MTKGLKFFLRWAYILQGPTNLIFTCTDFRAHKIVLRARPYTQNYLCIKHYMLIYIV